MKCGWKCYRTPWHQYSPGYHEASVFRTIMSLFHAIDHSFKEEVKHNLTHQNCFQLKDRTGRAIFLITPKLTFTASEHAIKAKIHVSNTSQRLSFCNFWPTLSNNYINHANLRSHFGTENIAQTIVALIKQGDHGYVLSYVHNSWNGFNRYINVQRILFEILIDFLEVLQHVFTFFSTNFSTMKQIIDAFT